MLDAVLFLSDWFGSVMRMRLRTSQPPIPKLFKLQLGVIGISDVGFVKPKVPLLD